MDKLLSSSSKNATVDNDNPFQMMEKLESLKLLLKEVEEAASVGSWEYDIEKKALYWSDETYRIYGLPTDAPISPEYGIKFYSPEVQKIISKAFEKAISSNTAYDLELPFIDSNDKAKWIRTTGRVKLRSGIVTHVYGVFEDLTYQKELLDSQQEAAANFKTIIENLNDAIVTISESGKILSSNALVKKIFGYKPNELIGKNISILMPEPFSSRHQSYVDQYLATGKAGIIGIGRELLALKKDGTRFSMELSISEVLHKNRKIFIGIIRDVTERVKAQSHINKLAYYDELTGALNNISFNRDLVKIISTESARPKASAIFLLNLDKFSQVNLIHSERIADLLLRDIATRINKQMPPWGKVYRYNADNFFIMLSNIGAHSLYDITLQKLNTVAKNILEEINHSFYIEGHEIFITASIGILDNSKGIVKLDEVKPLLELAVRHAKTNGGSQIYHAESKEISYLKRQSKLTMEMQSHKFLNELFLVLQPQCDTQGNIVGSEALVRWQSSSLGFISPVEFIPLAESIGKIQDIGNWVIDKVCTLLAQGRMLSNKHNPISINISAKQVAQPDFADILITKLTRYNIPHSEIMLELTESSLVKDFKLVKEKMRYLKDQGIHFSVDDFGTGYSNLIYLQNLPISELKIDKVFIDDIRDEFNDVPLVNSIIQIAKALNLKVVAEGVETREQLAYLKAKDCDVIQGYLFSKPLHVEYWLERTYIT